MHRVAETLKRWRDENRDRFNAWSREYWAKHRERLVHAKRERYHADLFESRRKGREWQALRRQRIAADPELVQEQKAKDAAKFQRFMERLRADPVAYERWKEKQRARYHAAKIKRGLGRESQQRKPKATGA